jgi:Protein of unknown function (DUF1580)
MVNDIFCETYLTLRELAKLKLPSETGGRSLPDLKALCRWALHGVHGVRLETARLHRETYTSVEAMLRFFERLSQVGTPGAGSGHMPFGWMPSRKRHEIWKLIHSLRTELHGHHPHQGPIVSPREPEPS